MDTLSYKTISLNNDTVEKEWVIIDATDIPLGRLASEAAKILRGKHKPGFTPHVDCGDNVIVTNCEKVKLTGNKWSDKVYLSYSGYPGGQKSITAKDLLAKTPHKLIENAVKGMLPKSRLGNAIYKNLFVYQGAEHPHQAQQPKEINLA